MRKPCFFRCWRWKRTSKVSAINGIGRCVALGIGVWRMVSLAAGRGSGRRASFVAVYQGGLSIFAPFSAQRPRLSCTRHGIISSLATAAKPSGGAGGWAFGVCASAPSRAKSRVRRRNVSGRRMFIGGKQTYYSADMFIGDDAVASIGGAEGA